MALNFLFDIYPGVRIFSATSGNGNVLAGGNTNVYSFSLQTGLQNWQSQSLAIQADSICLVNSASALIASGASTSIQLIELTAGFVQTYTGSRAIPNVQKAQQSASNNNGTVFICSSTTNEINKFNASTFSVSHLTPSSGMLGAQALTVINKTGSNNFIVGTNNGKLLEFDTGANTQQTVTLPTTPNVGTAPTLQITGLSYYNDNLFVLTNFGIGYHYKWSTSTLLNKFMLGASNQGSTIGGVLCDSACGVTLTGQNVARTSSTSSTVQIDFNYSPAIFIDTFFNDFTSAILATGIDTTTYRGWSALAGITSEKIRVYSILGIGQTSETTRIQSNGNDISGRILRIFGGPGKSRIETDQNIGAGQTNLAAEAQSTYIEIALNGTPNVNETGDVRIFQT